MKTLILNGSPRPHGDTAALLAIIRQTLRGEIDEISSYYSGISPCMDCRFCWANDGCAIDDAMQKVYADLPHYDNIIIASPVYFSELSGSLLALTSRLQYLWVAKTFRHRDLRGKPKKGAVVLVGGGDGKPDKALSSARTLLKQMNAIFVGQVSSLQTNRLPAAEDQEALARARELAEELNRIDDRNGETA